MPPRASRSASAPRTLAFSARNSLVGSRAAHAPRALHASDERSSVRLSPYATQPYRRLEGPGCGCGMPDSVKPTDWSAIRAEANRVKACHDVHPHEVINVLFTSAVRAEDMQGRSKNHSHIQSLESSRAHLFKLTSHMQEHLARTSSYVPLKPPRADNSSSSYARAAQRSRHSSSSSNVRSPSSLQPAWKNFSL